MLTDPFAEAIAEAEKLIETAPHIRSEQDLLEGYQYLAGGIIATTHAAWASEKTHPSFIQGTGPFTKMGLDNPDTLYFGARINDDKEYKVTGKRGTTADLSFQVLSGNYTNSNVPGSEIAFDDRELRDRRRRQLRRLVRPRPCRRPSQLLHPGARFLAVGRSRGLQRLESAARRDPNRAHRFDRNRTATADRRRDREAVRTGRKGTGHAGQDVAAVSGWFYLKLTVNTMTEPRLTPGGLATQYSSVGHYELTDEQAMIITVPASDAPYLGFQLGSLWYISLDYANHQTSLNNGQAQVDPDGMVRMVVSEKNPGVINWIETVGHPRGILQFRWQRVSRELTPEDGPTVEIVPVEDIAKHLPHFDTNAISAEDWAARIAQRQAAIDNRMLG
ncbi:DUF1214 domain-containing protein [Rhodococcus baikonurensis]